MEDPWNHASESYPQGKRVRGKVVSITDYGAFVEMEQGIEGLIHVSEMSWKKPKHPSKVLEIGQEVECQVLDVDVANKRISLGLKQLEPDPWTQFTTQYNPGDIIRGKVRSVTDYGVFIGIEDGVDGMVHKSDLSWTQRINNPADVYRKGDEVEAIILSINHDEKKVSLGIKQLYEDPWIRIPDQYPTGTVLEVRVISIADFGVFVELERGVEGLIHISELSDQNVDDPSKVVKEGEIIKAEIIAIDSEERRIALSLKSAAQREETVEAMKYVAEQRDTPAAAAGGAAKPAGPSGRAGATLGDLLKDKLSGISPTKEK
jgi:small subunit ribosomal protein S1